VSSGYIPAKDEPGPDEILEALREAVSGNSRLTEMPTEEVALLPSPPFMALGEPPPLRWCFSTSSSTRETPSSAEIRQRPGHRKKSMSFQSLKCFWIGPEFSNGGSYSLGRLSGGLVLAVRIKLQDLGRGAGG
jgi:hypothetical protein